MSELGKFDDKWSVFKPISIDTEGNSKTLRESFNDICKAAEKIMNTPKQIHIRAIDLLQLGDEALQIFDRCDVIVTGSFEQITELTKRYKNI